MSPLIRYNKCRVFISMSAATLVLSYSDSVSKVACRVSECNELEEQSTKNRRKGIPVVTTFTLETFRLRTSQH